MVFFSIIDAARFRTFPPPVRLIRPLSCAPTPGKDFDFACRDHARQSEPVCRFAQQCSRRCAKRSRRIFSRTRRCRRACSAGGGAIIPITVRRPSTVSSTKSYWCAGPARTASSFARASKNAAEADLTVLRGHPRCGRAPRRVAEALGDAVTPEEALRLRLSPSALRVRSTASATPTISRCASSTRRSVAGALPSLDTRWTCRCTGAGKDGPPSRACAAAAVRAAAQCGTGAAAASAPSRHSQRSRQAAWKASCRTAARWNSTARSYRGDMRLRGRN